MERVPFPVQRHGSGDSAAFRSRATGLVLLGAYLLLVGWLTLRPLTVPWVMATNLRPLATIRAELADGSWSSLRHLGGDLLLLAPLGVLLPVATGRLRDPRLSLLARTVCTGAMLSLGIAMLQVNLAGRTIDVDALLLNTAGVALAHLTLHPLVRSRLRRWDDKRSREREETRTAEPLLREDAPQGVTPKIPRVGIAP